MTSMISIPSYLFSNSVMSPDRPTVNFSTSRDPFLSLLSVPEMEQNW